MLNKKTFLSGMLSTCNYRLNDKILLAVSGGIDSVVLAHLFHSAEIPFAIAHVNYGLRGKEADGDEKFVKTLAAKYDVPFHLKKCLKKEISRKDANLQEKARDLRYAFFNTITEKEKLRFIATAHQSDDNIETVILNFIRGTGLRGMTGMKFRSGKIIRPLLNYSRGEVLEYAKKNKLKWRNDSSNSEDEYTRNIVRNRLLSEIAAHVPQGTKGMLISISRLAETDHLLSMALNQWIKEKIRTENGMQVVTQQVLNEKVNLSFFGQYLRKLGFNGTQVSMVKENVQRGRGAFMISTKDHFLNRDRDNFWIGSREQTRSKPKLSAELSSFPKKEELRPDAAFIDADRVGELTHRSWQPGDRMIPYGMKGKKKVSDILNEMKLPAHEKREMQLVVNGEEIVWIPGYRIADKFRITPDTKRVLRLTFED